MPKALRDLPSAAKQDRSSKNWYLGLDGVRAVAVLLVFSVHYMGPATLYAGWTGVLIFFVLSGFLITGILYDNQHEPFRFRNFYIRRTLRIFPLFYFAWVLVFIAGAFLEIHWKPLQFLWLTYLGNYVRFLAGSEALDHIVTSKPQFPLEIGHFWSLAVEEQFYLLWPLVVFHVRSRKQLIRICICMILVVLALRVVLWAELPAGLLSLEILYRLTFTQCDGFLLGALMALWMRGPEKDRLLRYSREILYGSLALVAAAYLINNRGHALVLADSSPWMSTYGFTLVDLAAAGFILCSLQPGSLIFRVTAAWPLRMLGRYSYGVYVYHVLLLPFLHYYILPLNDSVASHPHHARSALGWVIYFCIVLAVSVCSYHLVEQPFLALKDRFTVRHRNPGAQTAELSMQ